MGDVVVRHRLDVGDDVGTTVRAEEVAEALLDRQYASTACGVGSARRAVTSPCSASKTGKSPVSLARRATLMCR